MLFEVRKASDEAVLGLILLLEFKESLTVDVPKTERRSIVERLLFFVGDLAPGGSTMETRFFEP